MNDIPSPPPSHAPSHAASHVAFRGGVLFAQGSLAEVASAVRGANETGEGARVAVFPIEGGRRIDLDLRGSVEDVVARYAPDRHPDPSVEAPGPPGEETESPARARGRGRPRLGVVGKEVTLLPRHWAWLSSQRGGASATLRRLVEEARRASAENDRIRASQDAAYGFVSEMAGDEQGFEEAARALYARDATRFAEHSVSWPADIRRHALTLAAPALEAVDED